jgi:S-adenosylmethionine hydrolase
MLERPIITLTTDFGFKDPFVGVMKGVILGINPQAEIIDISHSITPQNILEASQVLSMSYSYFPPSTIHVAVVDPGVGGLRKPLLVVSDPYFFIGPDNGIFTPVFSQEQTGNVHVIHLSSANYFLPVKGATFHGRDIFAPVAAWLSKGVSSEKFGSEAEDYIKLSLPKATFDGKTLSGEVVYIDCFGNAITNITKTLIENLSHALSREELKIVYKDSQLTLAKYYEEKERHGLSAILNSFDFLELFLYKGSATDRFDINIGDKVTVSVR